MACPPRARGCVLSGITRRCSMLHPSTKRRAAAFFVACVLLLASAALLNGCRRDANQVPELQGQAAIDASGKITGFALLTAGRGEHEGEVALELEFSQPLVTSQEF